MDSRWPGFRPGWASLQANCDLPRWIKRREADVKYMNLVGGLEHGFYDFPYIGNVIIPTDEVIFFRGVGLNHQPVKYMTAWSQKAAMMGLPIIIFLRDGGLTSEQWWRAYLFKFNRPFYLSNRKGVLPNGGKVGQLKPVNYFPFVQKWCSRSVYIYIYTYTDSAP